ncbi:hypothetical protein EOPP23_09915 [Endozoicomonas sp. OPT23]|uniref:inositol polyphosphate kinase family protein n=1 Tax=Endozoicomonas sp. OPT23 TaxID=2072845 RepID=UPI00129AC1C6|nr:inositol polyphosphate kinase family protein [Endozoicomonas sp. OPT23]MRI33298.1 hypothetical protein [Endozoicomonas sp. OPT23]
MEPTSRPGASSAGRQTNDSPSTDSDSRAKGELNRWDVSKTNAARGKLKRQSAAQNTANKQRSATTQTNVFTTSLTQPEAGRGVVKVCDSEYVEKRMTKWEVLNYTRLIQEPQNEPLTAYLPAEVKWQGSSPGTLYDLRKHTPSDTDMDILDLADSRHEMTVTMTNASPSGTALDVKLGDLICYEGDLLHGKNSWGRYTKSYWHGFKQRTNKSAVTIQTTNKKLGRELSELKQDKDFIPLLFGKADFTGLNELAKSDKIVEMINQLKGLKNAVEACSVGFVGCSVLLSFDARDQMVTLIDLENCIMPEDTEHRDKITPKMIEAQKANFIRGIDTLISHLSAQTWEVV